MGRHRQGAGGPTTSWHGSVTLADRCWAAGLRQRVQMSLHSFWVCGTDLPPPLASSPVRSSEHQCGAGHRPSVRARVLRGLGAPAEPIPRAAGAAAQPQPRPSLTFLKCTDSPCT